MAITLDTSTEFGARVHDRLIYERIAWLTTVDANGMPQPVPIWFYWDGDAVIIYSKSDQAKLRNIARSPLVSLHFDSDARGGDIVAFAANAVVDETVPLAIDHPAYLEKYHAGILSIGMTHESFSETYSVPLVLTLEKGARSLGRRRNWRHQQKENRVVSELQNELQFERATQVLASGVSAGMRLNPYIGAPLYIDHGQGAYLFGTDGKRYIDLNMSNGAALLGHDHPAVREAVIHGTELGIICAAETPYHEQLASRIVEIIPAAERVRFSSVGGEVTIVALRIARAATGRDKYLKFDGHFHGSDRTMALSAV